jgi:transcriptional regulator with XRE-family HTH domain
LAQVAEDSPVTPEEAFAANLHRLRSARGYSQEDLAERTGLHASEISRLERGAREPRLGTIVKLARGLGVSADRLMKGIK